MIAAPSGCSGLHYYQTFAAGALTSMPLRQSKLESLPQAKKVCNSKVVNRMLVNQRYRRLKWDIEILPPQNDGEMFYRCIFGEGERNGALDLRPPP
jgi:hypothetical protein